MTRMEDGWREGSLDSIAPRLHRQNKRRTRRVVIEARTFAGVAPRPKVRVTARGLVFLGFVWGLLVAGVTWSVIATVH